MSKIYQITKDPRGNCDWNGYRSSDIFVEADNILEVAKRLPGNIVGYELDRGGWISKYNGHGDKCHTIPNAEWNEALAIDATRLQKSNGYQNWDIDLVKVIKIDSVDLLDKPRLI